MNTETIPSRKDVPAKDKWDLTKLYTNDEAWEADLKKIKTLTKKAALYKGKLSSSASTFLEALKAYEKIDMILEQVYHYAELLHCADESDSSAQDKSGRVMMALTAIRSAWSYFLPEMMAIPEKKIQSWITKNEFSNYKIFIEKALRMKQTVLSEKEEKLIALLGESSQTPENTFSLLTNVDLNFGTIKVKGKQKPLTQSTWSQFINNPDREIRKEAYTKFYATYEQHQNTLASLYSGSVNQDIFYARSRGFKSSLEASLFSDKVPVSVYHNIIETVHSNFDSLHRYYKLRQQILNVDELRHYDVYVPLVKNIKTKTSYEQSVEIIRNALSILGDEYTDTLCNGLLNGWADRYENKGKRSGAFSSGGYVGYPYILLNYKDDEIRDVFTMAHEGGHSMHSFYSKNNNPYMCYNYTIFEAEVASTFNEELVFEYLLKTAESDEKKAYLLSMRASDILATLHRQTMFAEYELKAHEMVENGQPLNAEVLRSIYRKLLEDYFGKTMHFESNSDMEGLRIPHFYSSYYVYKYATGISASLSLAKKVTEGGKKEKDNYFKFLKSGGSRYPIESLKLGGVDMRTTAPIQSALDTFKNLVDQMEKIIIKK